MKTATVLASGCKVNLYLRITGRRADGYHELDTLFLPLNEPHDTLTITPESGEGIRVTCSEPAVDPLNNTLVRAYGRFATATGFAPAIHVHLEKGVPHGAGLGGGSADAATLLHHLNEHAPEPLDANALITLAAGVGADVPFFLIGAPARATGIGEVLTPHPVLLQGLTLLLACPPVRVSTPWAFAAWDKMHEFASDAQDCLTTTGDAVSSLFACSQWLRNDFEDVVLKAYPELHALKERLLRSGAGAAVMSGSGASVFGVYRHRQQAAEAAISLEGDGIAAFLHAF